MRTQREADMASAPEIDVRLGRRARRVHVLLASIAVLSLADLVITLTHLRSMGMAEANPVAAYLIRTTQSVPVLIAFKVLTVGVCVALLHRLRHERIGEFACWLSLGVLVWLSLIWGAYSDDMPAPPPEALVRQDGSEAWLRLD
jgi:hypothetical protein